VLRGRESIGRLLQIMTVSRTENTSYENKCYSLCFVALHASALFDKTAVANTVGGAEVQQYMLAYELKNRGAEIKFIVKDDPHIREKKIDSFELVKAYNPSVGIRFIRGIYPQFIKLWRALDKANCDVYYVRGAKYESGIVWLYCKLNKRLMVQAIAHDYDCSINTLHNLKGWFKKQLYLWALRGADLVLSQTVEQRELLQNNLKIGSEVIPNLMNINTDIDLKCRTRVRSVLWIATVKPIKQPYIFLELAKQFPNLNFTMIGPMSNKFELYRQNFIEAAIGVQNLRFIDYVPIDEIEKYFVGSDLLISTSEKEGFPNVFLQAWAHGKPVISFVDPDGVISRRGLGYVVESSREMEQAVREVSSKVCGDKLKIMGDNALKYVAEIHGANNVVESLSSKVTNLLSDRSL